MTRSPSTGIDNPISTARPATAKGTGCACSNSPHRANRGDRCRCRVAYGSAPALIRPPSAPSAAGSSVRVAASTKTTANMMPTAMVRTAGAGTNSTADRLTSTVSPDSTTALPAVSMVSATASRVSPALASASRKRATMNSA